MPPSGGDVFLIKKPEFIILVAKFYGQRYNYHGAFINQIHPMLTRIVKITRLLLLVIKGE